MRWTLRKCDALLGTVVAALAGLAVAQLPAFIQQYLQRLGGHIDEARLNLSQVATGANFRALDAAARDVLTSSLQARIGDLEAGARAIYGAGASARPFVFVREVDPDIALATWRSFEPAVPLGLTGLVYGLAGMVAGWLIYELLKAPVGLVLRRRHRPPTSFRRIEPS